jgi:cytochrome c oxidase subunit 2
MAFRERVAPLAASLTVALVCSAVTLCGAGPQKPSKSPSPLVAAGKLVYDKNACSACHAIAGKGGKSGPDLTHAGKGKSAAWMIVQIRTPRKHHPSGMMPAYGPDRIADKDLKALVAYMLSLK